MFDRILIANRGEIAVRVIRTARRMGVETVAVCSDADAHALHVELADRAVRLGPAAASESYLRGEAIIAAALETGAQAIHPGYGFLSENADFADAVEAAGLAFIGPSGAAIRAMGLKGEAKALMEAASVPVVPGYHGADQDDGLLAAEAARIGYPVLVKAVAGGGGKGMRRVDRAGDFAQALTSARREAVAAFGNDAVLIEKFIERPRHIEVQVFGDGTRAVHLFERDCSLQRRHQKVIEEAPAPGMTAAVRAAMTGAAVRAAEAIHYRGAGTVEFIADAAGGLRPDGFWFMEMNTRLQVEHPVTEAVTGLDLVEWQLRVAAGEPLPLAQDQIELNGHAVEARVYAEDVPAGFLPATGRLAALEFPEGLRADTGVRAGDRITPHYDPMIAKVVAHAPERAGAVAALRQGLLGTRAAGTETNLDFLARLLAVREFAAGDVHTGLIEARLEALSAAPSPPSEVLALAIALHAVPSDPLAGFALWQPLARAERFTLDETQVEARVEVLGPGRARVTIGEAGHEVALAPCGARIDGTRHAFWHHIGPDALTLVTGQGRWTFGIPDPLDRAAQAGPADGAVLAPMPGLVRSLAVAAGDRVGAGDALGAMEAMKMELVLRAPVDATVAEVPVAEGDQVEAGALLIRLEAEE